jgi:hypothetical protein
MSLASSLLTVVVLVSAGCTSTEKSGNSTRAPSTTSPSAVNDEPTLPTPTELLRTSASEQPVSTSGADECSSFVPAGYEFLWSKRLTVAQVQETVRTLVTLAPDGVTTTLALQGADPDAVASLCWGVKPDNAESWVQYYVGPSGATGVMCLASGSPLLVVNGTVNDACV